MIQDIFFWAYLVAMTAVYWLLPRRWRALFLAAGSFAFIVALDAVSAALLVAMAALLWTLLPALARRGRTGGLALATATLGMAGPLVAAKALNVAGFSWFDGSIASVAVPIGMSYYVFRLLSVAIDAYRDGRRPETGPAFLAYIFLFTIFPAGPIQRLDAGFVADSGRSFDEALFRQGLGRIIAGLLKQTVIVATLLRLRADWTHVGDLDRPVADALAACSVGKLWLALAMTYVASYLNLGAYTDIAVGASRLFGFRIVENYNLPVLARSLTDFWRRWHMSLSSWCQDYVYAPVVGLTRNPYIALVASFQVMGLWHVLGANRIAWGLYQAGGVIALSLLRARLRRHRQALNASRAWAGCGWLATQAFATAGFLFVLLEAGNDVVLSARLLVRLLTFGLV